MYGNVRQIGRTGRKCIKMHKKGGAGVGQNPQPQRLADPPTRSPCTAGRPFPRLRASGKLSRMEIIITEGDVRDYERTRALQIAEAYANADASLRELHKQQPDSVPSPFWLYRWRRDHPEFDLAMQDAEKCRAQNLADDVLAVADDAGAAAAHNRNRMVGRQWLAERLDRDRYSGSSQVNHRHSGTVHVDRAELTDDQLLMIMQGEASAIEGEAQRIADGTPHPPRVVGDPGGLHIPSDPSMSSTTFPRHPVTSNEDTDEREKRGSRAAAEADED